MSKEFFKNKNYLVTGSSGGIGAGIAKALAKEGANVGIHYNKRYEGAIETQKALEIFSVKTALYQADFTSIEETKKLIESFIADFGSIDGLISNAGLVFKGSIEDADESYWESVMQVNLRAPYILSRACLPHLKETKGVIVHTSSIHAQHQTEYLSAYASSKAGLESLMKSQALEWAKYGIRVNAIAPGVVPVERTEEYFSQPKNQELWLPHVPLNRLGKVEDLAEMLLFLCSDKASWITGQSFTVDGGLVARSNYPKRDEPVLLK